MPKIVDHALYKTELATRAAPLFSMHGYSGLGMRTIAKELGISKSALYHYFPTKEALFLACTDSVTRFNETLAGDVEFPDENDTMPVRVSKLIDLTKILETGFPNELSLLVDYLRGRTKPDIANDPSMKLSNKRFEDLMAVFVDKQDAKPVMCLLFGTLLMRYFDGDTTDFSEIEKWLLEHL